MKQLSILLLSFFMLSSFVPTTGNDDKKKKCKTVNTVFNPNEELRYKIFYNWNVLWVPAGYVDFEAKESTYAGKPSYLLKATGKTLSAYDPIYKVRDYYHSYIDKETMQPLKYVRDTDEGGYTTYEELRFDYDRNKIESKSGRTKEKAEDKEFKLKNCTYDVVSIMYHLRNLDLDGRKKGEKIPIKVFFDEEQYDLYVKYMGIDEVKVKGQGKFRCHKVSPLLIEGDVFTETDQMTVWVTDDENKIPVLIETPIKVGSIKAVIQHAENLKYPVKAKL